MEPLFTLAQRAAQPALRIAMGIILLWIGALKFLDPSPVVGLLDASLPFLAFSQFVYLLGAAEVVLAVLLLANVATKYAGLALVGLFAGTLFIFLVAPRVVYGDAGFPLLSLAGEFLLKDLVLLAASVNIVAAASAREATPRAAAQLRRTTT
jgi:uncharacterized membrane protein YkgB